MEKKTIGIDYELMEMGRRIREALDQGRFQEFRDTYSRKLEEKL